MMTLFKQRLFAYKATGVQGMGTLCRNPLHIKKPLRINEAAFLN